MQRALWAVLCCLMATSVVSQPYFREALQGILDINLAQENDATTPTLSFGDGDTGLYEISDDIIGLAIGGANVLQFESTRMYQGAGASGTALIVYDGSTSGNVPAYGFWGDTNAGLFRAAADSPAISCGTTECARFEDIDTLGAGETALHIYDVDNTSLDQVTVGAADSGGAGFKVLRIPN